MSSSLKIKLSLIFVYLTVALFYHKHYFPTYTGTIYHYENMPFFIVAMSFRVILSATLYNLSLYLYIRKTPHLYYALAQLSALFFLMNLDSLFIAPFDEMFGLKSLMLFDISQIFMLFFSILFLEAFFRHYQIEKLDRLIKLILVLSVVDLFLTLIFSHAVITKFIPIFIPIWLVLSEALRLTKKIDVAFKLVIMGWSMVLSVVIVEYIGFVEITGISFPFFHIAVALESVILSLAIAYKFKLLEDNRKLQQTLLLQQSRLASMGEMISIIAHQWRQPLNFLSFGLMNIKKELKESKRGLGIVEQLNLELQYMSSTIEDFRNFYNPSKMKTQFDIYDACKQAQSILNSSLELHEITLKIDKKENFTLYGNQNEFVQVILNIINNAKDALVSRKVKEPQIEIVIDKSTIIITDNAGGIERKYLSKIFEPYFSTKEDSDGIGLYLVKMIVEKELGGEICVETYGECTRFIVLF
ncbi:hypothetical protein GSY74_10430 [Sulfurovum sp. bin170]|uniref:sensor histidine kinase n=1 Tax=Sulfurovum sp. bin170 TaxID=2695268 RepID=UPI0013DEDF35|nr:sensor histidine kinase [Sulfurovum sp. bin170]NEW61702.1 hypothetical protein [Sulfurovum sp. bin170]